MRGLQTRWLRVVLLAAAAFALSGVAVQAKEAQSKSKSTTAKVDLNTATEQELEALPGVGAATAAKIIAARPFAKVSDLDKTGIPAKTIAEIKPLVTVHKTSTTAKSDASDTKEKAPKSADKTASSSRSSSSKTSSGKIDVNSASEAELEELPGVGPATAQKIIAGRPYASVSELEKAGVSAKTLAEIRPMVTAKKPASSAASAPGAASSRSSASASTSSGSTSSSSKSAAAKASASAKPAANDEGEEVAARTPPRAGLVWVNTDSKVYHVEGDRWYGKTKKGEWMTEAEAIKAGYRPVKEPAAKPKE